MHPPKEKFFHPPKKISPQKIFLLDFAKALCYISLMENDPLLAELRGLSGNPELSQPDASAHPAETAQPDPLDVAPRPKQGSLVKQADAKFSTRAGGKGYRVVVGGDYYTRSADSSGKVLKPFELAFNLPHLEAALSTIVSKLLLSALQKNYPGVINFRTHTIISATPLTPDTPPTTSLQFMDRERLERYIQDNGVPIDPNVYEDVVHLREAVIDHKLNPKDFDKREARRRAARAEMAELLAMNPDLVEPSGKEEPVNA